MNTYGAFLEIADIFVARGQAAIEEIEIRVRDLPRELTLAEQVSGGLVLKMLASFEALAADVHNGRGEAMHHLKTLCEAYIYLFEAAASNERAAIVMAYACDERIKRGNDPRRPDPELVSAATARRNELPHRGAVPRYIERVARVADRHKPHLPTWYAGVYRLACEPAHIADLDDFLPTRISLPRRDSTFRLRRAYEALYHGLAIMLWVADFWNGKNQLNHSIEVQDLWERFFGKNPT